MIVAIQQTSELLTVREAATLVKVSPLTISRYLRQGRLRAYRVGPRAIRVRRADVETLLKPVDSGSDVPGAKLPNEAELARRRAIVEQILNRRQERVIAPLTAAELVRRARDDDTWYGSER